MRNAAATFDDDYGSAGLPRRGAARPRTAAGTAKKNKKGERRSLFAIHGVARYAAIGMAATMALGIMVNALVLQKGHHPAPLFGKTAASSPAPAAATKAAIVSPTPPPRSAALEEPAAADVAPVKSHRTTGTSRATETVGSVDAIGQLLSGGLQTPSKTKPAPAKGGAGKSDGIKAASTKTVTGAQRALTKLGFKVAATGMNGPATRKAIEAFQKNHHLPVHGELDRKMVKLLAAESGVAID